MEKRAIKMFQIIGIIDLMIVIIIDTYSFIKGEKSKKNLCLFVTCVVCSIIAIIALILQL